MYSNDKVIPIVDAVCSTISKYNKLTLREVNYSCKSRASKSRVTVIKSEHALREMQTMVTVDSL